MSREMKDSGVEWIGEIPKTWNIAAIKRNFNIKSGATPITTREEYWGGSIPWITPADYKTEDVYVYEGRRCLSEMGYNACGVSIIPKESIIFSKRAPIGTVCINKVPLCTNQGCLSCIPREKTNNKYFYYLMSIATKQFYLYSSGTTFKEISAESFSNFLLPIPLYEEQKLIANYVDCKCNKISKILENIQNSIEDYKKLKKSIITQAISRGIDYNHNSVMKDNESIWFPNIPTHWEMKKIKYLFHIKKEIAGKEGITVLSITQRGIMPKNTDKNEGQLAADYSNYQIVSKGDFAMNHMDLLTGWVDISKYDGVTSPDYRVFVLNDKSKYDNRYYLYLMQMCYFNKIFYGLGQGVSGLGRWRLQSDKFLNFKVPVPPIKEQREIVSYLDKECSEIDKLIKVKEQYLIELKNYKSSLIYEYVTGKKEVPNNE